MKAEASKPLAKVFTEGSEGKQVGVIVMLRGKFAFQPTWDAGENIPGRFAATSPMEMREQLAEKGLRYEDASVREQADTTESRKLRTAVRDPVTNKIYVGRPGARHASVIKRLPQETIDRLDAHDHPEDHVGHMVGGRFSPLADRMYGPGAIKTIHEATSDGGQPHPWYDSLPPQVQEQFTAQFPHSRLKMLDDGFKGESMGQPAHHQKAAAEHKFLAEYYKSNGNKLLMRENLHAGFLHDRGSQNPQGSLAANKFTERLNLQSANAQQKQQEGTSMDNTTQEISQDRLLAMLEAEAEMAASWKNMDDRAKKVYLKAHPSSRFRVGKHRDEPVKFDNHMAKYGWKKAGARTWKHKNGHVIKFKTPTEHTYHVEIHHPNGDVTTRRTNEHSRVGNVISTYALHGTKGRKIAWGGNKAPMKRAKQVDVKSPIKRAAPMKEKITKTEPKAAVKPMRGRSVSSAKDAAIQKHSTKKRARTESDWE